MFINKHDIDNAKRWFHDKWFKLTHSDEAMLGIFYIVIAGFIFWIAK